MEENKEILEEQENNTEEVKDDAVEEKKEEYNGPTIVTHTKYDFRTMKYYNVYTMKYKKHFALIYVVFALIAVGLSVFNIISIIQGSKAEDAQPIGAMSFFFPAILILFGIYFVYQAICFEKQIDKNIATHFYRNPRVVKIEMTVTEEEIRLRTDSNPGESYPYNWAYVNQIVELPQYYFMFAGRQPLIIEKDPNLVSSGNYDDLVNIINEKIKTKPYKKIDKDIVKRPITFKHPEEKVEVAEVVEEKNDEQE